MSYPLKKDLGAKSVLKKVSEVSVTHIENETTCTVFGGLSGLYVTR